MSLGHAEGQIFRRLVMDNHTHTLWYNITPLIEHDHGKAQSAVYQAYSMTGCKLFLQGNIHTVGITVFLSRFGPFLRSELKFAKQ